MSKFIKKSGSQEVFVMFFFCLFLLRGPNLFGEKADFPEPTKDEREQIEKMIEEHYKNTDSLRYLCHKGQLFERMGEKLKREKGNKLYFLVNFLYESAGVVYGRVQRVEGHPEDSVYHTWVYIQPYKIFKNIVTDSNGYVVVKEFSGPGPTGSGIAGMRPFKEGDSVLVVLTDIPETGLGMSSVPLCSSTMWKKAIIENKIPITSIDRYYQLAIVFLVGEDGKIMWIPRGRGRSYPEVEIEVALKELQKTEVMWKKFTNIRLEEK